MHIEHQQLWCWARLFTLPIARSDDTHWLSDKPCRHRLPPILKAQSATRWKPGLWPKSPQRSTLGPNVSLGGEEKQHWCHILRSTDVWTCRGPPVQALCYPWFALSLSHKSKCLTWHPTQQSTLLCQQLHQMQHGWPSLRMPSCFEERGNMPCSCWHCVPAHLIFDEITNTL